MGKKDDYRVPLRSGLSEAFLRVLEKRMGSFPFSSTISRFSFAVSIYSYCPFLFLLSYVTIMTFPKYSWYLAVADQNLA